LSGKRRITNRTLAALAVAFEVHPDFLVHLQNKRRRS
jgi:hypothetical protein